MFFIVLPMTNKKEMEAKDYNNIEAILKKYFEGSVTETDRKKLYELLQSPENSHSFKGILFDLLTEFKAENETGDSEVMDRIYSNILDEITGNEEEMQERQIKFIPVLRRLLIYGSSIAAIFIVAFFLGNQSKSRNSGHPSEIRYTEINAPFGSRSEIKLPDGSSVKLNAGSSLKYSNDFNSKNRDLTLVGEAYFKVAKNVDLPFNVNAGNISVRAVGTEFNVRAYNDDSIIETTLIEGKVKISTNTHDIKNEQYLDLTENQKATYFKETGNLAMGKSDSIETSIVEPVKLPENNIIISSTVDVKQVVAWTQGKLIIRGKNIDDLCIELQRKYDVSFVFRDEEIKKYHFSGVLLDETIEQVLNVIKLTAPIEYSIEGKIVSLSINKEQINNYNKYLK